MPRACRKTTRCRGRLPVQVNPAAQPHKLSGAHCAARSRDHCHHDAVLMHLATGGASANPTLYLA